METLLSPQLPLEGAMLLEAPLRRSRRSVKLKEFIHVQLTGGEPPGEEYLAIDANEFGCAGRDDLLRKLVARYEDRGDALSLVRHAGAAHRQGRLRSSGARARMDARRGEDE